MNKKIIYALVTLITIGTAGFMLLNSQRKAKDSADTQYALLPRKGLLAKADEWIITQDNVANLQRKITANSNDGKAKIALANYFILEGRATGNYAYYNPLALDIINNLLENDPNNVDALTLQSLIFLSEHQFAEGLASAEKARNITPFNAFLQGLLVDGNVELGNYDTALACAQRMMEIRPDLRSYSRASYLREIHGDYEGAISAMKMAIDAGVPGDEATEWGRIQLGQLYEITGDLKNAEMNYKIALEHRPGYMYALAGIAQLALAEKDYSKSIQYYQLAAKDAQEGTFDLELANVFFLAGQKEKGMQLSKKMIHALDDHSSEGHSHPHTMNAHPADRELSIAFLLIGDYDQALEHALLEYKRRPKNIEVNEAVAWVYYKKGEVAKSLPYVKAALRTNNKNPALLCKAGLIYAKIGETEKGEMYIRQGLMNHANIDERLVTEAEKVLNQ